jgi:hypothetical protein
MSTLLIHSLFEIIKSTFFRLRSDVVYENTRPHVSRLLKWTING